MGQFWSKQETRAREGVVKTNGEAVSSPNGKTKTPNPNGKEGLDIVAQPAAAFVDPRSISDNLTRTPIQIKDEEEENDDDEKDEVKEKMVTSGIDEVKQNFETPTSAEKLLQKKFKSLSLDPRSPSGIPRTPILVDDKEEEDGNGKDVQKDDTPVVGEKKVKRNHIEILDLQEDPGSDANVPDQKEALCDDVKISEEKEPKEVDVSATIRDESKDVEILGEDKDPGSDAVVSDEEKDEDNDVEVLEKTDQSNEVVVLEKTDQSIDVEVLEKKEDADSDVEVIEEKEEKEEGEITDTSDEEDGKEEKDSDKSF